MFKLCLRGQHQCWRIHVLLRGQGWWCWSLLSCRSCQDIHLSQGLFCLEGSRWWRYWHLAPKKRFLGYDTKSKEFNADIHRQHIFRLHVANYMPRRKTRRRKRSHGDPWCRCCFLTVPSDSSWFQYRYKYKKYFFKKVEQITRRYATRCFFLIFLPIQ